MKGSYDEVLEQCFAVLEVNIRTSREICGLLEEDGIGSENLAHIYSDFLGDGWGCEEDY